jgi:hypothetical protein
VKSLLYIGEVVLVVGEGCYNLAILAFIEATSASTASLADLACDKKVFKLAFSVSNLLISVFCCSAFASDYTIISIFFSQVYLHYYRSDVIISS